MSRKIPEPCLTDANPAGDRHFQKLKRSLRSAIDSGATADILLAVMKLGEHANEKPSDWIVSPRAFYELADALRQLHNDGQMTNKGQEAVLKLLRTPSAQ